MGSEKPDQRRGRSFRDTVLIMLGGIIVGLLAGLVGAGGGFLIVPALILLTPLNMKEAVGTSLLVIAIQSLIGFLGELGNDAVRTDLGFLLLFSGIAVIGALIGAYGSRYVQSDRLKPIFGTFVLVMAIGILIAEWMGASAI